MKKNKAAQTSKSIKFQLECSCCPRQCGISHNRYKWIINVNHSVIFPTVRNYQFLTNVHLELLENVRFSTNREFKEFFEVWLIRALILYIPPRMIMAEIALNGHENGKNRQSSVGNRT